VSQCGKVGGVQTFRTKQRWQGIGRWTALLGLALLVFQSCSPAADRSASSRSATTVVRPQAASAAGTDSGPGAKPGADVPSSYRYSRRQADAVAQRQKATTLATYYFTPQDENTSTTVLFLYNRSGKDVGVSIKTYYTNGSATLSVVLRLPAHNLIRICSDAVNTVSASWANYVLLNFTTFSAYGVITAPRSVSVDGYVAWDTTGTYNPLDADYTLPLRFDARTQRAVAPSPPPPTPTP
jgi:hypothetical protein